MILFAEDWNVQYNARSNSWNLKFAFRYSFARSTRRILREGSSSKIKMCVSLQRRAINNFEMYVSLQRRAQKCMKEGAMSAAARGIQKSSFYHSIGCPTSTKWRKGSRSHRKICISPQFWTSDEHEVMKGLLDDLKKLHFTTVLNVRRARSDEKVASATHKICISPSFLSVRRAQSTEGCLPIVSAKPILRKKKFKEKQHFGRAAFLSAALLRSLSQQLFSAAFLSSLSQQLFQQPFSAALLSSLSQQLFSAAFLSSLSQQLFQQPFSAPFSAALPSSFFQQPVSAAFLSSASQQFFQHPFPAAFLSSLAQQPFSAAILSYHVAVVRGWWSEINIILLL